MKPHSPFPSDVDEGRARLLSDDYQALVTAGRRLPPPHVCNGRCEYTKRIAAVRSAETRAVREVVRG